MLKVIMILDNQIASPDTPIQFTKNYYLTNVAKEDLRYLEVEQGDDFKINNNTGILKE